MRIDWRAIAFCGLALMLAGCGGKTDADGQQQPRDAMQEVLVAKVGGRPVTQSYYEERLEKMERKYLPDTLDMAGRHEFLQFILNKEIMALKAEELEYDKDPQIQSNLEFLERTMVLKTALDKLTEGKTEVTPEEVQDFYNRKQEEVLTKHILLQTRAIAEEVHAQLLDGADFDSLANLLSIAPRTDQNGDPLPLSQRTIFGWVEYGKAQPWVEKALFETPMNQVTPPIQTSYGWHLFLPTSRRQKKLTPLNDMSELIEQQLTLRKRREIVEAYYEEIMNEHGFKLDENVLDLAFSMIPEDQDPRNAPDPASEVKPIIPFSQAERERVLFELDGKPYTLGDLSDRYDETSFFERPKRYGGSLGLRFWIRDFWLKDLQYERARKDGIQKLPEVTNELAFRREQMMVSTLHANLIAGQVPEPTEEELQAFFEKYAETYVDKEKRVCNLIFHSRERVVRRAYDEIQRGADFINVAIRYNDNATEAKDVQTMAFTRDDPEFAEIAEAAWSLDKGEYGEPFKTSQGWVLLQVQLIIAEKPFELDQIREFVVRDWNNDWSEKRLNEMLEDWKQGVEIEIYEDALRNAEIRRDDVYVPAEASAGTNESKASETH